MGVTWIKSGLLGCVPFWFSRRRFLSLSFLLSNAPCFSCRGPRLWSSESVLFSSKFTFYLETALASTSESPLLLYPFNHPCDYMVPMGNIQGNLFQVIWLAALIHLCLSSPLSYNREPREGRSEPEMACYEQPLDWVWLSWSPRLSPIGDPLRNHNAPQNWLNRGTRVQSFMDCPCLPPCLWLPPKVSFPCATEMGLYVQGAWEGKVLQGTARVS